jgi:hypothetical protein
LFLFYHVWTMFLHHQPHPCHGLLQRNSRAFGN